jgi:hypothetical protein
VEYRFPLEPIGIVVFITLFPRFARFLDKVRLIVPTCSDHTNWTWALDRSYWMLLGVLVVVVLPLAITVAITKSEVLFVIGLLLAAVALAAVVGLRLYYKLTLPRLISASGGVVKLSGVSEHFVRACGAVDPQHMPQSGRQYLEQYAPTGTAKGAVKFNPVLVGAGVAGVLLFVCCGGCGVMQSFFRPQPFPPMAGPLNFPPQPSTPPVPYVPPTPGMTPPVPAYSPSPYPSAYTPPATAPAYATTPNATPSSATPSTATTSSETPASTATTTPSEPTATSSDPMPTPTASAPTSPAADGEPGRPVKQVTDLKPGDPVYAKVFGEWVSTEVIGVQDPVAIVKVPVSQFSAQERRLPAVWLRHRDAPTQTATASPDGLPGTPVSDLAQLKPGALVFAERAGQWQEGEFVRMLSPRKALIRAPGPGGRPWDMPYSLTSVRLRGEATGAKPQPATGKTKPLPANAVSSATSSDERKNESRTWTDASGKHKIEATLTSVDDAKVTLTKADGTTVTLPLAKLSKADQDYVQKQGGRAP